MRLPLRHIFTPAFLALTLIVSGQERTGMYDYDLVKDNSPWLTSRNAAGTGMMPISRIAKAEGYFNKCNGGLTGTENSGNSFEAGIYTESYVKISEKIHFNGLLSYGYFNGREMGGPIFMDPWYNPINFYEQSDTTVGPKNRETYRLAGAMSYKISDKWQVGASAYYESADQTKTKDPRFLNVWMDLDIGLGVRFAPSDRFSIGLSAEYRKTLEQVSGDIYGLESKQFFTFIDKGGFYGSRELFEGSYGYIATGDYRPMYNAFYGGSLQIEAGRDIRFFNELTYLHRSGYYGRRSSSTVTFSEHSGNILEYHAALTFSRPDAMHRIGVKFRMEDLVNAENIYRMNTEVGESTVVEYFGQNDILDRTDFSEALFYKGYSGIRDFCPIWEYGAGVDGYMRNSVTTIYPYYRTYAIGHFDVRAHGKRNLLIRGRNLLTFGIEGYFSGGAGKPSEDGRLASSTSDAPLSADTYMYKDFEYRTAIRAGGKVSIRYTRLFGERIAAYAEAADKYISLLKQPEYLENGYRNTLAITIGCTF